MPFLFWGGLLSLLHWRFRLTSSDISDYPLKLVKKESWKDGEPCLASIRSSVTNITVWWALPFNFPEHGQYKPLSACKDGGSLWGGPLIMWPCAFIYCRLSGTDHSFLGNDCLLYPPFEAPMISGLICRKDSNCTCPTFLDKEGGEIAQMNAET